MNRIFLAISFLLSVVVIQAQGIAFTEGSWAEIKAQAKAENKLIFMDAYTTWCGPCKWLAANVFTDAEVGEVMNTHFINSKFDMEAGEGLDIASEYGVIAYPTLLFVNGDGELVHRICGAMPSEPFLEAMNKVVAGEGLLSTLIDEYESGNRSIPFMVSYLDAMSGACMDAADEAQELYDMLDNEQLLEPRILSTMVNFAPAMESNAMRILCEARVQMAAEEILKQIDEVLLNAVYQYLLPSLRTTDEDAYPAQKEQLMALHLPNLDYPTLRLDLMYYRRIGNWEEYVKTATRLVEEAPGIDPNLLNDIAWTIYESEAGSEADEKALEWARMAKDANPTYSILDTYAALLFKTGRKAEGKAAALEAIEAAKSEGEDYSGTGKLNMRFSQ
jgi:thioredoxin-related protein